MPSPPATATRFEFDGILFYVKTWHANPDVEFKGKILVLHGFMEHAENFNHFWPFFADHGYEVIFYDQRGSGQTSKSKKDYSVTSEYHVFNDLEHLLYALVLKDYNGKVFLWGFSMGGGIVLNYAVKGINRERIDGFVANQPMIETSPEVTPNAFLRSLLPILQRFWPRMKHTPYLPDEYCSDDPQVYKSYGVDKFRRKLTTPEHMGDAITRGKRLLNSVFVGKFVDRPVYVAQGTADRVTDFKASEKFFGLLQVSDKTFKQYEGGPHELQTCLQPRQNQYRDDVLEWLDAHAGGDSRFKDKVKVVEEKKKGVLAAAVKTARQNSATESAPESADKVVEVPVTNAAVPATTESAADSSKVVEVPVTKVAVEAPNSAEPAEPATESPPLEKVVEVPVTEVAVEAPKPAETSTGPVVASEPVKGEVAAAPVSAPEPAPIEAATVVEPAAVESQIAKEAAPVDTAEGLGESAAAERSPVEPSETPKESSANFAVAEAEAEPTSEASSREESAEPESEATPEAESGAKTVTAQPSKDTVGGSKKNKKKKKKGKK